MQRFRRPPNEDIVGSSGMKSQKNADWSAQRQPSQQLNEYAMRAVPGWVPHRESRGSADRLAILHQYFDVFNRRALCGITPLIKFLSLSTIISLSISSSQTYMMKADLSLSAIFRQLRPSLPQPRPAYLHPRTLSQLAPLRHPSFLPPPHTPKRGISKPPPLPLHSLQSRRISDSTSIPSSAVAHSTDYPSNTQIPPEKPPAYELTFTCKPCKQRSTHTVSKQGYHKGTVLITCPQCSNRHLISDHLKVGSFSKASACLIRSIERLEVVVADRVQIFRDQSTTLEDLMRQKGQLVKRGILGEKGDVEFWEDGTQTEPRQG